MLVIELKIAPTARPVNRSKALLETRCVKKVPNEMVQLVHTHTHTHTDITRHNQTLTKNSKRTHSEPKLSFPS